MFPPSTCTIWMCRQLAFKSTHAKLGKLQPRSRYRIFNLAIFIAFMMLSSMLLVQARGVSMARKRLFCHEYFGSCQEDLLNGGQNSSSISNSPIFTSRMRSVSRARTYDDMRERSAFDIPKGCKSTRCVA